MEQILELLKSDLGISHSKRDNYLKKLIENSKYELEAKGIKLDTENVEDMILISDYTAWTYRKRTEDIGMSQNLTFRIRNRVVKARASDV
ncbi:MAG: hypothetical protein ACOCM4_13135 [Acetivibrio ethanolgignens]